MPSPTWDRFYESYFGDPYMAWHDGLDEESLLALEGEERERAEQMLTDALGSGDYRAPAGLAALRSDRSLDALKQKLPQASGPDEVQTALAIWRIDPKYLPAANALVRVLRTNPDWGTRLEAARALREVPTPSAIDALWEAVERDPEDLVRHHAAAALLYMYNIHRDVYDSHPLTIEVMMEDAERREKAKRDLRELVEKEGRLEGD
jgi:HEAT repeat protein